MIAPVLILELAKGNVRLDLSDHSLVCGYRWHVVKSKNTFYARAHIQRNGKRTSINMQNLLVGCPKQPVDHEDRNGLNNVRSNLRVLTHYQNLQNYSSKKGLSKYKGVSFFYQGKSHILWRAVIGVGYRQIKLGLFRSEEDAARAYDKAALEHFGPTAYLNCSEFPL
jgi:hypothetical protein